jgi:hypothetical protein
MLVKVCNPAGAGADPSKRLGPCRPPKAFFCARVPQVLCVSVAFGVVSVGKRLWHPQGHARLPERQRGRLAAIVTHPGHALVPGLRGTGD